MIKYFTILFLLFSVACFGQSDKKGTIKVKKTPTPFVVKKADSVLLDTIKNNLSFRIVREGSLPTSYGQLYDGYPHFIGNYGAQDKFVDANRIFPECNRCRGTTQISILTITVNEDESLSDIIVKKGAADSKQCDEEAIRIVKLMPNWVPAALNGENIKIKWDVEIHFKYL